MTRMTWLVCALIAVAGRMHREGQLITEHPAHDRGPILHLDGAFDSLTQQWEIKESEGAGGQA